MSKGRMSGFTPRAYRPRWGVRLRGIKPRWVVGLAALLTGCVGSGAGVPAPAAQGSVPQSFAEIQEQIFTPMCAEPCHRGGAAPKGLSLEPTRALTSLVGVPSVEAPDLLRVDPGHPERSYLIVKVSPADPRRAGARMPRNGPPFLGFGQIRALKQWVAAGATSDWVYTEQPAPDAGPVVPVPDGATAPDVGASVLAEDAARADAAGTPVRADSVVRGDAGEGRAGAPGGADAQEVSP